MTASPFTLALFPSKFPAGQTISTRLQVENISEQLLLNLIVHLPPPSGTTVIVTGGPSFNTSLKPGETKDFPLKIKAARPGEYALPVKNISYIHGGIPGRRAEIQVPFMALDPDPKPQEILARYESAIFAIENDKEEFAGTGFFVLFQGKVYAVTCAHVINDLGEIQDSMVTLQHFDPNVGKLKAKVLWFGGNKDKLNPPEKWKAKEDISVLWLLSPISVNLDPLPLEDSTEYQGKTECRCFGYVTSRVKRGAWMNKITCDHQVGQGFIQLSQHGEIKIEQGASGAPLYYIQRGQAKIIGMIQSRYGEDVAYLIPSKTILDLLSSLPEDLEQQGD